MSLKLISAKAPMVVCMFLMDRGSPGTHLLKQSLIFHGNWPKELSDFPQNFHPEEILTSWCFLQFQVWIKRKYSGRFLWVEKFWWLFVRNNYLAEWNSLVQTSLSLHMLQVKSWRAVVPELLAYYFAFQATGLIWLMHFSCQLFTPLTIALDKNVVVSV